MSDVPSNLQVLRRLAALGLKVAVDDFGTGYSSLAQLLRLPVSSIKIDREFVSRLDVHSESRAITSAVLGLARALELYPVAEGVENEAQLGALCEMGCDAVQGFLLHRPMSIEDFLELVSHQPE
jgi:EAL domain-containing protein (putative c-di-GMP-specific phosphodiesterase class I)